MRLSINGKELEKGNLELYRNFDKEKEVGKKVSYSLVLDGEVSLFLNADAIEYNLDGTGRITVNITETYPTNYWSVSKKQSCDIDSSRRQSLIDLLKSKGFEEYKPKEEKMPF